MELDVLILGGGINGTGMARDAAGRGLSVLLCEKNDLASGTSCASSKLIHGGLRYLEYGEFRLVREALAERETLLTIAPHLIQPLRFHLPWQKHLRPRWLIRLGLFLYDHLAKRQTLPASGAERYRQPNPLKVQEGFHYSDCWVDDARLVVLNALDAQERGAQIFTHSQCRILAREADAWQVAIDTPTHSLTVRAKVLINATGPWVSETQHDLLPNAPTARVQKIQGSHMVVPKWYDHKDAYILQHTDQRIVFVLPFAEHYSLIGTTDTPFEGDPQTAHLSADESQYLCDIVNHYFHHQIKPEDIVWHYSGVRALWADPTKPARAMSRDYHVELNTEGAPLLTVYGGKITTYRQLALHALKQLQPYLNSKQGPWTDQQPLPGGDLQGLSWPAFVQAMTQRYAFLPASTVLRLCKAYGSRIDQVLKQATELSDLGQCFGGDLYEAEVNYVCQYEWVRQVEDLLWRRSKIGLQLSSIQIQRLQDYLACMSPN